MLTLNMFGFRALWSPFFFLAILIVTIGFFLITVKYRDKFKDTEALTTKQGVYFTTGMILLYAIKGSPLDLMGHLMFYAHMIQMAVLYLVIPPLFIVGIPQWIWKKILNQPFLNNVFRFFTKPLIALILFNGMFSFYHIPLIFDIIKIDMWMHASYTVLLFVMAIFMWWPLINQVEGEHRLSGVKKIGYIFADGILLTPACALIIFADVPMYDTFSDPSAWAKALELCVSPTILSTLSLSGPEMFNSMSLLHDQQLGGVLMKVLQEIVYGVVLFQVFFEWYRKEQEETEAEKLHRLDPQSVE
ncbi:cytochrome c oxidase assembly factor CtaG [Robertmurraya kyonggiensis]|uniref:Cytochrome c oxidase assembly factor CtaG n=1 Tax=Robertmurraya kyonggiensis TaxID=1037680 RepID=A0A4U1D977_9BACI|nr:cytochrome c oxidase assembly factor CtaG [Robertmurraya kyonggiensis]TKC18533.1 cytochrome c oxidase assembly factor CtaG [Robertmurraya kyonggiensis]